MTLDLDLVQTGQGVPAGGRNSAWEYNGEALYDFNVDFGKLGLWPGGFLKIFAESQFGPGVNLNTGAIQIVAPGLFPVGQQGGSWSVYYNFDQYVYTEPELRRQ